MIWRSFANCHPKHKEIGTAKQYKSEGKLLSQFKAQLHMIPPPLMQSQENSGLGQELLIPALKAANPF